MLRYQFADDLVGLPRLHGLMVYLAAGSDLALRKHLARFAG